VENSSGGATVEQAQPVVMLLMFATQSPDALFCHGETRQTCEASELSRRFRVESLAGI
jgi:hypothetical protein